MPPLSAYPINNNVFILLFKCYMLYVVSTTHKLVEVDNLLVYTDMRVYEFLTWIILISQRWTEHTAVSVSIITIQIVTQGVSTNFMLPGCAILMIPIITF